MKLSHREISDLRFMTATMTRCHAWKETVVSNERIFQDRQVGPAKYAASNLMYVLSSDLSVISHATSPSCNWLLSLFCDLSNRIGQPLQETAQLSEMESKGRASVVSTFINCVCSSAARNVGRKKKPRRFILFIGQAIPEAIFRLLLTQETVFAPPH